MSGYFRCAWLFLRCLRVQDVLGKWQIPILNDTYVMLFFGLLKKLVARWMKGAEGMDDNKVPTQVFSHLIIMMCTFTVH